LMSIPFKETNLGACQQDTQDMKSVFDFCILLYLFLVSLISMQFFCFLFQFAHAFFFSSSANFVFFTLYSLWTSTMPEKTQETTGKS